MSAESFPSRPLANLKVVTNSLITNGGGLKKVIFNYSIIYVLHKIDYGNVERLLYYLEYYSQIHSERHV